jgi:hypothetical protein
MLVGTNETISVRLRMTPTKREKRQGQKRKNATADQDIEGSKERKVPALVMWYLPIIDHLKHMFSNPRDVELLLWHVNRKTDGKIQHPADGRQQKQFDLAHQEDFSNDSRRWKDLLLTTLISILNKPAMTSMFFRTIDGGHVETLGIWGHYVG